jgi:hypothetical protein
MPTPTGQTLTTMAVADGVAAEITTPADSTVWTEPTITVKRQWLPTPSDSALNVPYISVIALGRGRRGREPDPAPTPKSGRFTRATIRSTHRVKVVCQARISSDPAVYDGPGGRIDQLAAFLMQVEDYWNVKHRQVNAITGLTGKTGVVLWESSVTLYDPKAVDTNMLFVGEIDLAFSEITPW